MNKRPATPPAVRRPPKRIRVHRFNIGDRVIISPPDGEEHGVIVETGARDQSWAYTVLQDSQYHIEVPFDTNECIRLEQPSDLTYKVGDKVVCSVAEAPGYNFIATVTQLHSSTTSKTFPYRVQANTKLPFCTSDGCDQCSVFIERDHPEVIQDIEGNCLAFSISDSVLVRVGEEYIPGKILKYFQRDEGDGTHNTFNYMVAAENSTILIMTDNCTEICPPNTECGNCGHCGIFPKEHLMKMGSSLPGYCHKNSKHNDAKLFCFQCIDAMEHSCEENACASCPMALEGKQILSRYECCHCHEVFCAECDDTKQSGQALDGEEGMCFKCRVNKKPNDDQEPGDPS
mgnify:FL=1